MEKGEYDKLYLLEDTHWWYRGLRESVLRFLAQPDLEQIRVLDAGCGTGGLLAALQIHGTIYGMDISQEALAKCRQRGLQPLIRGSVTHIPFPDRSLDCILSLDVLYHSEVDDDEGALREFHRVLRTSGKLIL